MTISDFDPIALGQYRNAPKFLHFQWEGDDRRICRYALVDRIPAHQIDSRTKRALKDGDKTHDELLREYLK